LKKGKIQLIDKNGELSSMTSLIAKDLFRKLDKISLDNALQFEEISEFLQVGFDEKIDER
jgi:hypothetical protein